MNDRFIILSDIHANLSALKAVINDMEIRGYHPDGIVILGDCINYGMRPNEVVERLIALEKKHRVIVNLFGNHEKALFDGDTTHFSTERGRQILDYTKKRMIPKSLEYMDKLKKEGYQALVLGNKKCLFVHGSLQDPFWGKINADTVKNERYSDYDYVFSGHSHIPHLIEHFYDSEDSEYRNKKRTVFINPGSVGQPRNHNPRAQYLYMEISSETFHFNSMPYDIELEQALYTDEVDTFYSKRLKKGI